MKRKSLLALFAVFMLLFSGLGIAAAYSGELVIMDFNSGDNGKNEPNENNLGGQYGAWDKDPNDSTQTCAIYFVEDDALGEPTGYALKLKYDVDSPNPAYNGFWAKLEGEDFSFYNTLNIYIKGVASEGYPKGVKVELKNYRTSASYFLEGITDEWQRFSIPFEKFKGITDWSSMDEFTIVFDDVNSVPKEGAILIDHVSVSQE